MSALTESSSLEDWLSHLENLHPTEIELGLDRIREVAKRLALQTPYQVITVAGTNGKGSVCAMLEAILRSAGYKTGMLTSPHLIDFNERIRVASEPATDAMIVQQFQRIEAAREEITLTYFEYATLAALLLFQDSDLDVAILEVGLGGRLDAVNLVDADCAIVTSIDIDHQAYLGDSREQIAWEKAHVFRSGKPAICADPEPPQSLVDYAQEVGADLWLFGRDFNYSGDQLQWAYGGRSQRRGALVYPALRGANQLLNAAAALAGLESLREHLVVPAHALRLGFLHAVLPGRFQILPGVPSIILDVAHNPHAAAALAQNLGNMPTTGTTYAVVGVYNDKDVLGIMRHLVELIDHWYCASLSGVRGMKAENLVSIIKHAQGQPFRIDEDRLEEEKPASRHPVVKPVIRPRKQVRQSTYTTFENPEAAFRQARQQVTDNDRILVFGSFATVGPVLKVLAQDGLY